jgi:chromosome segregation ATPase
MANGSLAQTVRQTLDEVSAKRNVALLEVERLKAAFRDAAASRASAENRKNMATERVDVIHERHRELLEYLNAQSEKPSALLRKLDDLAKQLAGLDAERQACDQALEVCQQSLDRAQLDLTVAERSSARLVAEVAELHTHFSRLN